MLRAKSASSNVRSHRVGELLRRPGLISWLSSWVAGRSEPLPAAKSTSVILALKPVTALMKSRRRIAAPGSERDTITAGNCDRRNGVKSQFCNAKILGRSCRLWARGIVSGLLVVDCVRRSQISGARRVQ